MRDMRLLGFFGIFFGTIVTAAPSMAAEGDQAARVCETERRATKRREALPLDWLRLSECLEKAGDVAGAVAAAQEALQRALPRAGVTLFLPEPVRDALLQLDDLGVDIEIPPPELCGSLPPSESCARPLFACTHRLSGKNERGVAFERLVVNAAHFPKESRLLDDDGTDPTWGQHWRIHNPNMCSWSQRGYGEPAISEGDHATVVLRSHVLSECPDDAVGCRIESPEGGPLTLGTVECRLVEADACREVLATVCTRKLMDSPAERYVDLFRVRREH